MQASGSSTIISRPQARAVCCHGTRRAGRKFLTQRVEIQLVQQSPGKRYCPLQSTSGQTRMSVSPHATATAFPIQFSTVPYLVCAPGAAKEIGKLIQSRFREVRRPLIVTDAGVVHAGLLRDLMASLQGSGLQPTVYDQVVADPPEATVQQVVDHSRRASSDMIIGFGGGSSMDVAKLLSVLATGQQSLTMMYGMDKVIGPKLPLIQVPTTAGTGSEVTPIAIVTTGETTKTGVVSPYLFADVAVLDAELTIGLPPHVTAATGIDAMVHAIEAYTSRHKKNPLSDMLARQALALLWNNLERATEQGNDLDARQAMLLGAMLAGQAFANAPVAAVHALAYPIGGLFHVPHGLSNALVLPHVLRFNAVVAAKQYAELAEIIVPESRGNDAARADGMITALEQMAQRVGIATQLRAVGITGEDIDRLADDAMLQTRLLGNNPRDLSRSDVHAIYTAAL